MKSKNSPNAKVRFTAMYDEQANASPYWPNVNRAGNIYDNSDSLVVERCSKAHKERMDRFTRDSALDVTALASVCLHDDTFIQPGPMLTD